MGREVGFGPGSGEDGLGTVWYKWCPVSCLLVALSLIEVVCLSSINNPLHCSIHSSIHSPVHSPTHSWARSHVPVFTTVVRLSFTNWLAHVPQVTLEELFAAAALPADANVKKSAGLVFRLPNTSREDRWILQLLADAEMSYGHDGVDSYSHIKLSELAAHVDTGAPGTESFQVRCGRSFSGQFLLTFD